MKYLVAVSGGIDSVVLLCMLVEEQKHDLIVAHFDHGIREDSADDARFVGLLAKTYHLPFLTTREELGKEASEELARKRRYHFLKTEAENHNATIVTAHHQDDIIETVAINLTRGTGWRGLAVLDTPGIERPLLGFTKKEIREYARAKRLEWVEDSTNSQDVYLRNRIRARLNVGLSDDQKHGIVTLWQKQRKLRGRIDEEVAHFTGEQKQARYFFIQADPLAALEVLRAVIASKGSSPTRPQLERALLAIKTANAGSSVDIGAGQKLRFTTDSFIVETP